MAKLNSEDNLRLVKLGLAQYTDYISLLNDNEKKLISQFLVSQMSNNELLTMISLMNSSEISKSSDSEHLMHVEFFMEQDNKCMEYCKWIDENHFISTIYLVNKECDTKIKEKLYKTTYPRGKEFIWLATKESEYDKRFLSLISTEDCFNISEKLIFLEHRKDEYQRYQKCLRNNN